ncbi:uncharacterized protein LOC106641744 [Copidosoma floridanum]|uniref:uncharacterized protein LOC106641744 n=1 Tax=Copidosoma floridanum TaxID=29053 RepID=UPI0006C947A8|nr:uncharacterized protein LOC106641744 [Copidosoma floridanum]
MRNEGNTFSTSTEGTLKPIQVPIQPFIPDTSIWSRWLQRFEGALGIMKIKETEKAAYLLHYIGEEAYNKLGDHLESDDPYAKTFQEIKDTLKDLYEPAHLEIAENFKFNSRKQQPGEDIQSFADALNKLSITCNFGIFKNTALRNQLVYGLANRRIQGRLLETKDLTYTRAMQTALVMELSHSS